MNIIPLSPPTKRDLQVTWRPTRPDFTIQLLHELGTRMNCYSETFFKVVSVRQLDADDFKRLDEIGLLGIGQAYSVLKEEQFDDLVPPVTIDKRTGVVTDIPPVNDYTGEPYTTTYAYAYYRYTVRRVCDSGD